MTAPAMKKLHELDVNEIRGAIGRLPALEGVVIESSGMMPEADVLLCSMHGKRFNAYVDLAYGAELKPVDGLTKLEMEELARKIETAASVKTP